MQFQIPKSYGLLVTTVKQNYKCRFCSQIRLLHFSHYTP